jgi:nucleoside-diphosphate-sugar epimerase
MAAADAGAGEVFLVFGSTGYLGERVVKLLHEQGKHVVCAKSRLDNHADVERCVRAWVLDAMHACMCRSLCASACKCHDDDGDDDDE